MGQITQIVERPRTLDLCESTTGTWVRTAQPARSLSESNLAHQGKRVKTALHHLGGPVHQCLTFRVDKIGQDTPLRRAVLL